MNGSPRCLFTGVNDIPNARFRELINY